MIVKAMSFSSIPEILMNTVARYPERLAMIGRKGSYTYGELASKIFSGTGRIRNRLPVQCARVAIIGDNDPAYIIAYFAAQFLCLPTVEISNHESLETLVEILGKTEIGFLVTDREDLKAKIQNDIHVESFEEFFSGCEEESVKDLDSLNMLRLTESDCEASIIFTSGTTGKPKGVILSHGNFSFMTSCVADYLSLNEEDKYGLMLPLYHTYGKIVMLSSFSVGASVLLLENFQKLPQFLSKIADQRCSILSAVPYHAHIILKWGNFSKYDLSSLRAMTFSGNRLPADTIDRLKESLPGVQIFSMYGLTESTTRVCYVPPGMLSSKKESCGRPLPGVEIRIAGDDNMELPVGEVGEVLVRGPNVMKGYFGDLELSKKTVVEGWLKTGDLGALDDEGFLYLKGRMKDIIKCAGERISATEIEDILLGHPMVSEAAVKGTADPILGEVVHAFVVPVDGSIEERDLRAYCAKKLSHHKIPRRYTFVDELPKTATGKIRKHLLIGE